GFGYRRCAGEFINMGLFEDLLRKVWRDNITFTRISTSNKPNCYRWHRERWSPTTSASREGDRGAALVHMRCSAVGALLRTWCALTMTTEGLNHARRGDSSARCPGTRYGSHHTWTLSCVP